MSRHERVLVAMSGGVDSSVAAALLKERGYDCVGVFMWVGPAGDESAPPAPTWESAGLPVSRLKKGCCSVGDACDARAVAARLGIPFYSVNFQADFAGLITYFVDEYARARTPNPCVLCNSRLKFGKLLAYADLLDAQYVATGHYARLLSAADDGWPRLARAVNRAKDQSYALFGIARGNLRRCLFPLGEIADKGDVRRIAADLGLPVHDKPESQEICFVPDGDYASIVTARRPDAVRPGLIVDSTGRELGRHPGIVHYTIGQRHGLRIAAGRPVYVTELDAASNTVVVGPREELLSTGLVAEAVNWLVPPPVDYEERPAQIQIRYRHAAAPGRLRRLAADPRAAPPAGATDSTEGEMLEVRFDEAQPAVTPGQAAVFYEDDIVLGGGWIARSLRTSSQPSSGDAYGASRD